MAQTIALEGIISCSVFHFHEDTLIFRFHELRHTFASMANNARVPMYQISRAMGHSSPNITQRIYTHLFDQTHGEVLAAVADVVKTGSASLPSA